MQTKDGYTKTLRLMLTNVLFFPPPYNLHIDDPDSVRIKIQIFYGGSDPDPPF